MRFYCTTLSQSAELQDLRVLFHLVPLHYHSSVVCADSSWQPSCPAKAGRLTATGSCLSFRMPSCHADGKIGARRKSYRKDTYEEQIAGSETVFCKYPLSRFLEMFALADTTSGKSPDVSVGRYLSPPEKDLASAILKDDIYTWNWHVSFHLIPQPIRHPLARSPSSQRKRGHSSIVQRTSACLGVSFSNGLPVALFEPKLRSNASFAEFSN
jgi:hypothetical protein